MPYNSSWCWAGPAVRLSVRSPAAEAEAEAGCMSAPFVNLYIAANEDLRKKRWFQRVMPLEMLCCAPDYHVNKELRGCDGEESDKNSLACGPILYVLRCSKVRDSQSQKWSRRPRLSHTFSCLGTLMGPANCLP